jgi:hypothetical protein
VSDIEHFGFAFSPDDLVIRNIEVREGVASNEPELADHMQATMQTIAQLLQGAVVERVYATPEGAAYQTPQRLNFELVLSNGRRLCVMGDWRAKIYQSSVACVQELEL